MDELRNKLPPKTRRVLVGFLGWLMLIVGVVMIPYPGPGWVVVFIALSILATEFAWARDVHMFARGRYDAWQAWLAAQPVYIRAIFWVLTALTTLVTVWIINGYGLINNWLGLGQDWLTSPFLR